MTCLTNYHPAALTPNIKCFERLVMHHIKVNLPNSLDPLQLAYCPNWSTNDAIFTALHWSLTYPDKRNSCQVAVCQPQLNTVHQDERVGPQHPLFDLDFRLLDKRSHSICIGPIVLCASRYRKMAAQQSSAQNKLSNLQRTCIQGGDNETDYLV